MTTRHRAYIILGGLLHIFFRTLNLTLNYFWWFIYLQPSRPVHFTYLLTLLRALFCVDQSVKNHPSETGRSFSLVTKGGGKTSKPVSMCRKGQRDVWHYSVCEREKEKREEDSRTLLWQFRKQVPDLDPLRAKHEVAHVTSWGRSVTSGELIHYVTKLCWLLVQREETNCTQ